MSPQATPTATPARAAAPGHQGTQSLSGGWEASGHQGGQVLPRQAARCLAYIAGHPGSSSTDVQNGVGIQHASQVSTVLLRLERDGLAQTERSRRVLNAWTITAQGAELLGALPEGIYE